MIILATTVFTKIVEIQNKHTVLRKKLNHTAHRQNTNTHATLVQYELMPNGPGRAQKGK